MKEKRDSWARPHRNRQRYQIRFWFSEKNFLGINVAVPAPVQANLEKFRDEVIAANREEWFRPKYRQEYLGKKKGQPVYRVVPVLDARGNQVREAILKRVTADFLGADI